MMTGVFGACVVVSTLAVLGLFLPAVRVEGHPLCYLDATSPVLDATSTFCPNDDPDGFCCTADDEAALQSTFLASGVTGTCADLYQEVCWRLAAAGGGSYVFASTEVSSFSGSSTVHTHMVPLESLSPLYRSARRDYRGFCCSILQLNVVVRTVRSVLFEMICEDRCRGVCGDLMTGIWQNFPKRMKCAMEYSPRSFAPPLYSPLWSALSVIKEPHPRA